MPLREHNPNLPIALEKVILKCLQREPDRRYPFMGVLVRDLQVRFTFEKLRQAFR